MRKGVPSHLGALDRIHHRTKGLSQEAREPSDCNGPRIGLGWGLNESAVMTLGLCGGWASGRKNVCADVRAGHERYSVC